MIRISLLTLQIVFVLVFCLICMRISDLTEIKLKLFSSFHPSKSSLLIFHRIYFIMLPCFCQMDHIFCHGFSSYQPFNIYNDQGIHLFGIKGRLKLCKLKGKQAKHNLQEAQTDFSVTNFCPKQETETNLSIRNHRFKRSQTTECLHQSPSVSLLSSPLGQKALALKESEPCGAK